MPGRPWVLLGRAQGQRPLPWTLHSTPSLHPQPLPSLRCRHMFVEQNQILVKEKKKRTRPWRLCFLSLCHWPASDAWASLLTSLGLSCLLLVDRTKELLTWLLKGQQALAFAIATTLCLLRVPWGGAWLSVIRTSLHPSSQFILTSLRAKLLLL